MKKQIITNDYAEEILITFEDERYCIRRKNRMKTPHPISVIILNPSEAQKIAEFIKRTLKND